MPQLIAMVLVVVGALVYMFQTFGGTGNNIEGMAQKTSVITEINNIKSGISIALRSKDIDYATTNNGLDITTLKDLADKEYFTTQINQQINKNFENNATQTNVYDTISFGSDGSMKISLVINDRATQVETGLENIGTVTTTKTQIDWVPGINVKISESLNENKAFLESQLAKDLEAIAWVDRGNDNLDGDFTVYFKDLPKDRIKIK